MKILFYLYAILFFSHLSFSNYLDRDDVQDFIDFMHVEHGFSKDFISKTLSQASKQQSKASCMYKTSWIGT